jgi:hypothetical protein
MKTLKEFLKKHNACEDGYLFAKDFTLEQFLNNCERGDWILWLFARSNPRNKELRTLIAGHCANTVRHLMENERSKEAVDMAIKYGEGKATRKQLDDAYAAAYAAYAAADAANAAANAADAAAATTAAAAATTAAAAAANAAYAAYAAANAAAAAAANAADAADAAAAAYDAYAATNAAARKKNQKLTADICRKYLPIEIWNIK